MSEVPPVVGNEEAVEERTFAVSFDSNEDFSNVQWLDIIREYEWEGTAD